MPTKTTITVTIRLFAGYREAVGKAELPLDMPSGATVGDLAREMAKRYPGLPRDPKRLVVAVNQEYRDHSHALRDADEVALIPPVSGGAIYASSPLAGEASGHDPLWPKGEG